MRERQRHNAIEILMRRYLDSLYWCAPGGESLAQACMRVEQGTRPECNQPDSYIWIMIKHDRSIDSRALHKHKRTTHTVIHSLKTSCSGFRVLMVCHGNIMAGFRVRLERMSQQAFYDWEAGKADPREKIHNGQVRFIWTMIELTSQRACCASSNNVPINQSMHCHVVLHA